MTDLAFRPPRWRLTEDTFMPAGVSSLATASGRDYRPSRLHTSLVRHEIGELTDVLRLDPAERRLDELARLGPGWDGETARAINPSIIEAVHDFIVSKAITSLSVHPDLVPSLEGGILIEWHTVEVDLVIEASPSGEASYYFCDNETGKEVEESLGKGSDDIAFAFKKLGLQQ